MWRRVIRTQYQANNGEKEQGYFEKIIKYIPSEIIGAWIAIKGLVNGANEVTLLWILFILLTVITAVYIFKQTSGKTTTGDKAKPAIIQILISTVAFIIWVFALGEPFSSLPFYESKYGSVALIIYTLIIPLI